MINGILSSISPHMLLTNMYIYANIPGLFIREYSKLNFLFCMTDIQRTETTHTEVTTTHTPTHTPAPAPTVVHAPTHAQPQRSESTLLTDILSIIGFAIVFIIIIWGIFHLASLSGSWFSSWFTKPAPALTVNAPTEATSTYPMQISWNYTTTAVGSYAFLYECKNGLQFAAPEGAATSTFGTIPCGVAFMVPTSGNTMVVAPLLSSTSTASTLETISVVFIPKDGSSHVQGNATVTINPAHTAAATTSQTVTVGSSTSKPAQTSTNTGTTQYAGPADLQVRITGVSVDPSGNASVSFDIANVGGSTSGSYYFTAQLPTAQYYPYQSPQQAPLAPGAHIANTLNFNEATGGTFSVTVIGGDQDGANNYASTQISAPYNNGYNGGYNTNTQYSQYPVYPTPTYNY